MKITMKFFAGLISLTLFTGCATRSKYAPNLSDGKGGYNDWTVEGDVQASRFAGNSKTASSDAQKLAIFRAIENCYEKGFKLPVLFTIKDESRSSTVTKSASYSWQNPTYVTGTTYGNTFNGTATGGNSSTTGQVWTETYIAPSFDAYYICRNQVFQTRVIVKDVPADLIKDSVKDLVGGVQIDEVNENSPNKGVLQVGDIVLKINGNRIKSGTQMSLEVASAPEKAKIRFDILRDGRQKTIFVKAIDGTEQIMADFEKVIQKACTLSEIQSRPICKSRLPANQTQQAAPQPGGS